MTPPPPPVEVRGYREEDRSQLEPLWKTVFPDDPQWNAPGAMLDAKLRVQPELLLVAESGRELVGALMAGYDGVRGWLYHVAVEPAFRRRGIATQLVRAAERRLARLGCVKVNLQVRAANKEVVAFYQSLGYTVEDRISMGRSLDADR